MADLTVPDCDGNVYAIQDLSAKFRIADRGATTSILYAILRRIMETPGFDLLTPHVVMTAVESVFGLQLDGTLSVYPSYVNRVYGLCSDEAHNYVVKFYRPGRWNLEAIAEEHDFIADC
ncbi:hypothetical protein LCGC14_2006940, partial [marine sediment metagenome]